MVVSGEYHSWFDVLQHVHRELTKIEKSIIYVKRSCVMRLIKMFEFELNAFGFNQRQAYS